MRDGRAADQAGLAGALVDVRRPGARADAVDQPGVVFGPQRLDLSAAEPVLQQVDQVGPQLVPARARQLVAGQLRVEPVAEQRLRAVDVAHSGDHGLIHEQRRQRRPGAGDPGPGAVRVGVVAQRVRPEARVDDVDLGVGEQLAGGGAAQVRVVRRRRSSASAPGPGLRGRQPVVGEPPVQAQVHVHDERRVRSGGTGACRAPPPTRAPARRPAPRSSRSGPAGWTPRPAARRSGGCAGRRAGGGCGLRASARCRAAAAGCRCVRSRRPCRCAAGGAGRRENGVDTNASASAAASSRLCMRAPMATTWASLCWRPSFAVSTLQASAHRMPGTLFAAICSPLPEPPITMPRLPGSSRTACAAAMQ